MKADPAENRITPADTNLPMDSVLPEPPVLVEREGEGGSVDGTVPTSSTTNGPEGAVVLTGVRRTAEGETRAPEGGTSGWVQRRSVHGLLCTRRRVAD